MTVVTRKIGELYRQLVTLELKRRLSGCSGVLLLNFDKLKSAEMTQLRKDLKSAGASVLVTKNSFVRKVLEQTERPAEAGTFLEGQTAMVFVKEDPIVVSKALMNFAKGHEALKIRGGLLAERVLSADDIKTIAKLGSRQALYQQVAVVLNAPIGKLASSLSQIIAKLGYALNAVADKRK
jgi:large subunit ribosomal protein L10